MSNIDRIRDILDQTLNLGGRAREFTRDTALLGNVPELDSMAVVMVLTAIEEQLGIIIEDDDVSAETFETVGTLVDFVDAKVEGG